jgi:hypothetical protein
MRRQAALVIAIAVAIPGIVPDVAPDIRLVQREPVADS